MLLSSGTNSVTETFTGIIRRRSCGRRSLPVIRVFDLENADDGGWGGCYCREPSVWVDRRMVAIKRLRAQPFTVMNTCTGELCLSFLGMDQERRMCQIE